MKIETKTPIAAEIVDKIVERGNQRDYRRR